MADTAAITRHRLLPRVAPVALGASAVLWLATALILAYGPNAEPRCHLMPSGAEHTAVYGVSVAAITMGWVGAVCAITAVAAAAMWTAVNLRLASKENPWPYGRWAAFLIVAVVNLAISGLSLSSASFMAILTVFRCGP